MSDDVRLPAGAETLAEGDAVRFTVTLDGVRWPAFVLRWKGVLHAYVDACRHQTLPLAPGGGRYLDGDTLVCAHHGARYEPGTGECVSGPCRGRFLTALGLEARPDGLWCTGRAPRAGA